MMKATAITDFDNSAPLVPPPSLNLKLTSGRRVWPRPVALAVAVGLSVLIGWADYASGWELSLFIFYAVPIVVAVWHLGSTAGLLVAVFSGMVWWVANEGSHPYATQLGYNWAMLSRMFYFIVLVFAVTYVRNKQGADAAYIQMLEQRRQLEKDIVRVSEYEQQRIGQDLHDGLCQHLAAIGCAARVLAEDLQAHNTPAARDAVLIEESIQQAVIEARNLARGIFPVHVDRSGLAAALVDLGRTKSRLTGTSIVVRDCVDVPIDSPDVSMHLYRIAQEAVANAVKHSGATEVTIGTEIVDNELFLTVEDNGCGIAQNIDEEGEGMGLRTMRYRAQALGALLEFTSNPGGGTRVCCRLPLQPQTPNHEQN